MHEVLFNTLLNVLFNTIPNIKACYWYILYIKLINNSENMNFIYYNNRIL